MSSETRGYIWTGVKTASYSKLSVPGYSTIKYRSKPSATDYAAMKEDLLRKEGKAPEGTSYNKRLSSGEDTEQLEPLKKKQKVEEVPEVEAEEEIQVEINPLDRDDSDESEASGSEKGGKDDESDDEESDDDDDDDDELAEIQRQLERIKKEKAEEAAKKAAQEAEEAERERAEHMAAGNPLLASGSATGGRVTVKKWFEETIFKNQAAGEPQVKKRFINDTVRNDFHKRFLSKYMR